MTLAELKSRSIVIFGLGLEGVSTFEFLRGVFPEKPIGLADQKSPDQLDPEVQEKIQSEASVRLHLGADQLAGLREYEVIIKSPGIPPHLLRQALHAGQRVTSPTAIFFANCPGVIVGVTGTKGKSTTASLIHAILEVGGLHSCLVGNIGIPPLRFLQQAKPTTIFVYELSSYQLEELQQSPPIAVLLNIFQEHLDYHGGFEGYVQAKQNITRYQSEHDYLVYNAAFPLPRRIAAETKAKRLPFSLEEPLSPGCFVSGSRIVYASKAGENEEVMRTEEVPLLGRFNLHNVLAAVAVSKLLGVETEKVALAVQNFKPLEHRLELVGTYRGITFYNASIATIPEATIEHLNALGQDVQTVLLGGYDRHLDFSSLAHRLLNSQVKTLILFPTTGRRIWEAILAQRAATSHLRQCFFVQSMEEAVELAYRYTESGKICLHSPASPSFGLFKNYEERGRLFKHYVKKMGQSWNNDPPIGSSSWRS